MDPPGDSGDKLAGVRLSEGVEGVTLVLGKQLVPLLEKLIKIVCHIIIGCWQLVAEGVS